MRFFAHLREMDHPNVAELRAELDKIEARLRALEPAPPAPAPESTPAPEAPAITESSDGPA